jgi:hypothetical protein
MNSVSLLLGHSKSLPRGDFATLFDAATAEVAPNLSFNTRAEYLAWVAAWKHAYRHLSAEIRLAKTSARALQSRLPAKKSALESREASLRAQLASLGPVPPLVTQARALGVTVWGGPPQVQKAARYLLVLRRAGKRVAAGATRRVREGS